MSSAQLILEIYSIGQPKNGEFENLLAFYSPHSASHPKTGKEGYIHV